MSLTPEQHRAAHAPHSVAITAGAGTGKTFTLAERYLYHLLEEGLSPLQVVAVTFTEKAAMELRSRIRRLARQQQHSTEPSNGDRKPQTPFSEILAELEAAPISTFHSLAARICREHPDAAGVPADFRILDQIEAQLWLEEALLEVLDRLPESIYEKLPYRLLRTVLPPLLDDPISVKQAFRHSGEGWPELAAHLRNQGFEELLNHPVWRDSVEVLQSCIGRAGDKLETQRQNACIAIKRIQAGDPDARHLETLASIDLRGGSKKNWATGELDRVKAAIKPLRELVRNALKLGFVSLQTSELDDRLAEMLPALKEAFEYTWEDLMQQKRRSRLLTFADLEVCALNALNHDSVRQFYRQRFKAFLVDEFQDTNPIQAQLLDALASEAKLTIVGDVKQSIYGFRRADVRVFDRVRRQIARDNGDDVVLSLCFRAHHPLLDRVNRIFQPLLENLHQDLVAHRQEPPHDDPHIEVWTLDAPKGVDRAAKRRAEAQKIADIVTQLVAEKTPVRDKESDRLRPIDYGDIAILARTGRPLQTYADVLESRGIPVALAGGDSLLDTREAKDAFALLRFLADPDDDLALVAVLRSPFFAVSDRALLQIALTTPPRTSEKSPTWWQRLQTVDWASLDDVPHLNPVEVLRKLRTASFREVPSRLLQLVDRLTGYTAVLANLPGSTRREADWRGFRELVRQLEAEHQSLYGVVRRLLRLVAGEVKIPRLPLDASNAVSLMTVHKSKGLEWAAVFVADMTSRSPSPSSLVSFDPEYGVALTFDEDFEVSGKPVLQVWLQRLQQQREEAETLRLLYVALTRARDRLILTGCHRSGGYLDRLSPGLEAAEIPILTWPFPENLPENLNLDDPELPRLPEETAPALLSSVPLTADVLSFGALSDYAVCPKQFAYRHLYGHPGLDETLLVQQRCDRLVRKAIAHQLRDREVLRAIDPDLEERSLALVMDAIAQFDTHPVFQELRQLPMQGELRFALDFDGLELRGTAIELGDDGVLDVRTRLDRCLGVDGIVGTECHRLELLAVAQKLHKSRAILADLRHEKLYSWNVAEIQHEDEEILESIVTGVRSGHIAATPEAEKCQRCVYFAMCDERWD
ncbi:UvrD-helicase domain-containing protein [Baaleninema sp.]|uniref:UvrD-helicase domain-containing protein n=1 Tax=Baaleninema sp. TaxID=3101197 RepID=UPI003CFC5301